MAKRVGDKAAEQIAARAKARAQALEEKRAVLSLLQNRALVALFKAVDEKYARQARKAETPEESARVWAILRGLDALYVEMKARIDRGTDAQTKIDQEVKARRDRGATP